MALSAVVIALGDLLWVGSAFVLGLIISRIGLPPMVGFLLAGFLLNGLGVNNGATLQHLADLGITLLLFTVGLKLDLRSLTRAPIWGGALIHMALVTLGAAAFLFALVWVGVPSLGNTDAIAIWLIAFALSFSSTVFVVKSLEQKGELNSLYGRVAVGILIMQDLVAVVFLAISAGKVPSIWALGLLLFVPARPLLLWLIRQTGHGELLILLGFVFALGGAQLFDAVQVKADLGALVLGALLAGGPEAKELAKRMLGFKDLFLVGFFLTIGLTAPITPEVLWLGVLLLPLLVLKCVLYFGILMRFRLRARTTLLVTLSLSNYSEFGLIVAAIAQKNQWLEAKWLMAIAIALSLSFVLSAILNRKNDHIYQRYRPLWLRFQHHKRLVDDQPLHTANAGVAVFGMGRVGLGAYETLSSHYPGNVVGIDFDARRVEHQQQRGIRALQGDPADPDFWEKIEHAEPFHLIVLALPNLNANLDAIEQIRAVSMPEQLVAVAHYPEEHEQLIQAGADAVYDIFRETGSGLAQAAITASTRSEDSA